MIDDCPSFNKPIKKLKLIDLRCLIHIRRKFIEAFKSGHKKEFNTKILIKIGQLYRIEKLANKHDLSFDQRFELRQRFSKSIMDQIKALLCSPGFLITPKTATGIAINHFLKNWEQASRFLDSGDLPIDNSINERIIYQFALGRKNWMHAGSDNGGRWMGILYSIITTCKLNSIDPQEYLADILMRLPLRPAGTDISDLLPIEWYKAKNNGKMPEIQKLYPSKD
jgi:transposase